MNPQAHAALARMDTLGIAYTLHEHPPIAHAHNRFGLGLTFDAQVCKNLLVTTRNENRLLLLMLPAEKEADLKALRAAFGTTRLGFAGEALLRAVLGQSPGQVGICGVIHDTARRAEVVFDSALRGLAKVAMHPGDNTLTVIAAFADIENYVRSWGSPVHFYDF